MSEPAEKTAAAEPSPELVASLRSMFSPGFSELLHGLGISLAVTTYQAGKLVLVRPEVRDGAKNVNTHFLGFRKPMGLAWERGRIALGTANEVLEFHEMPGVARKLDESGKAGPRHDAVFLRRCSHVTGDIQIHEMVWVPRQAGGTKTDGIDASELWFVNTRFSCLARRSGIYSFVPGWRPKFITQLAPEDRCHLNGLGLRDGVMRYATALGTTDTAGGWRANKPAGGVLMDIPSDEIMVRGLSMPHSPRWYGGRLWLLESGNGGVGVVDERSGTYQEICRLPGFTRGIDFAGPYAFIGLSQVRESATFSGIKIAEMKQEDRMCGVWAVDLRTGQVAGFARFLDAVQEIFAVGVLPGMRWPEVLADESERLADSYVLPPEALAEVPEVLKAP
jgi:uncharacterized protein (TIGR03032 family)